MPTLLARASAAAHRAAWARHRPACPHTRRGLVWRSGGVESPSSDESSSPPPPAPPPTSLHLPPVPEHAPVTGRLYRYLLQHTREPAILTNLRVQTAAWAPGRERNAVSPDQGAFLGWLVGTLGVTRALEVGVFTGYSSTAMALALPPDGLLVACEKDDRPLALARATWEAAGVAGRVDCRVGPAADTLASLLADPAHGPASFDFAFIDADKRGYAAYYEAALALVRVGGVVAIDNVLWYGRVVDTTDESKSTVAVRDLNDALLADPRIAMSIVSVGDGIALCRRLA
jgi:O-methyltransferase